MKYSTLRIFQKKEFRQLILEFLNVKIMDMVTNSAKTDNIGP